MTAVTRRSPTAIRTWPTVLALMVIWAAALTGQIWVFALLFLGWAVSDVVTGESFLVQRLERRRNPVAFWAVVVTWAALAILWLLSQ
ncbi:MAG: hypothetical protein ACR2O6_03860 [Ilumatobacteraceae bacterium]